MTQSQHTQGPWVYDDVWGLITAGDVQVCALHSGIKANAQLIAAAPELLETLTYLKARLSEIVADELPALLEEGPTSELILSRLDSYTAKIDNAINKAKGETAQC